MEELNQLCIKRFGRSPRVHRTWSLKTKCHLLVPNSKKGRFEIYPVENNSSSALEKTAKSVLNEILNVNNLPVKEEDTNCRCCSIEKVNQKTTFLRKVRVEGSASYWAIWCQNAFKSKYKQYLNMDRKSKWVAKCVYTAENGDTTVKSSIRLTSKLALDAAAHKLAKTLANITLSNDEQLRVQKRSLDKYDKMCKYRYIKLSEVINDLTGEGQGECD